MLKDLDWILLHLFQVQGIPSTFAIWRCSKHLKSNHFGVFSVNTFVNIWLNEGSYKCPLISAWTIATKASSRGYNKIMWKWERTPIMKHQVISYTTPTSLTSSCEDINYVIRIVKLQLYNCHHYQIGHAIYKMSRT